MSDPRLLHVQQLLAEDHPEAAAEVLASVAHPLTQIWLDHLKAGGRDRLLLQESLALHADDPRIAEAQALIDQHDMDGATNVLSQINHPMTQIWLDHLRAGGRDRLMATEPATTGDPESTNALASGPQPHAQPAPDAAAPSATPVMDARMRRILELQQSPSMADEPQPAPILPVPESPTPIYRTDPVLTLTPPVRHGWQAIGDHWRTFNDYEKGAIGTLLALTILVVIATPPPFGPTALLTLLALMGAIRFARVTIKVNTTPQGEMVWDELAVFRGVTLWRFSLHHERPLLYAGPPVSAFNTPPAVLALNVAPDTQSVGNPDALQGFTIVKMTLLALWATGQIMIYLQQPQWWVLGTLVRGRKRYVMRPVGMMSAGTSVEDRVWAALAITPTVGRSLPALSKTLLSNPRYIVQLAENEALNVGAAKRSLVRRRVQVDGKNATINAETSALLTLHANVMLYHAPIYRLLTDHLARTAKVLPIHNYSIAR